MRREKTEAVRVVIRMNVEKKRKEKAKKEMVGHH